MKIFSKIEQLRNKHFLLLVSAISLFILFIDYGLGITYGMNTIIIIVCIASAIIKKGKALFVDWIPALLIFYVYEVSRSFAYDISVWLNRPLIVEELINIEMQLFGFLPNIRLQEIIDPVLTNPSIFDYVVLLFYGGFFWMWAVMGYYFWVKGRGLFKKYIYGLIAFSLVSVLIYILYPTAPPWYASEVGLIENLDRVIWEFHYLGMQSLHNVQEIGRNDFAAVPSLHTAWTFYMALFYTKVNKWKGVWMFIVPLGVAFSTWYGAEHYVIDSIAGVILAGLAFFLVNYLFDDEFRWRKKE